MKDLNNNPQLKKDTYMEVFSTEAGQAVLLDLFKANYVDHSTSHVPGDHHTSAYREGRRSAIWDIMLTINADVSQFIDAAQRHRRR